MEGIEPSGDHLVGQLAERNKDHLVGGRQIREVEKYVLTRISATGVDPDRASQPDNIREHRWWTLAELRTTAETAYSLGIADLLTGVLVHGAAAGPLPLTVDLTDSRDVTTPFALTPCVPRKAW
ncbi:NUDIX domain-containing protein [Streptomyces olivaceoviridis]